MLRLLRDVWTWTIGGSVITGFVSVVEVEMNGSVRRTRENELEDTDDDDDDEEVEEVEG